MDALKASYADSSTDSDSDFPPDVSRNLRPTNPETAAAAEPLPPPPLSHLNPPNFARPITRERGISSRIRSFPHVEGNYALHVFIPVLIPQPTKELAQFLKRVSAHVPDLHAVDIDIPLHSLCNDDQRLEHVSLGREFHISLGRTVPIRVHQIGSMVTMLRQNLQSQRRYWIDFSKWEVFVNDDRTRTFLSIEVTSGGFAEIMKQIQAVDYVYKLHNLPQFYKDPRPHISLAWALGDISDLLRRVVGQEVKKHTSIAGSSLKRIFTVQFGGINCKIGNKTYKIC
ncbi:hypothetical protein Nepgr_004382 [Nepenthes gracilis]|uniref:U6 snRNA phosphodiesterase n=1 Tax=Nepenthes gracilis TaxID=150966 RepID=A0AAD3S182_NEPGR|nr:hypothetical protein Nepgr_004382 [Nepenthes gracilis]